MEGNKNKSESMSYVSLLWNNISEFLCHVLKTLGHPKLSCYQPSIGGSKVSHDVIAFKCYIQYDYEGSVRLSSTLFSCTMGRNV